MKHLPLALILALVVGAAAWGFWAQHQASHKSGDVPSVVTKPITPRPPPAPLLASNEWQELSTARQIALKANPELADQYKAILTEMDDQQKKLEVAVTKVNPKMAPIVAKLESIRNRHVAPAGPSASPSVVTPNSLTPEEWQQLRVARQAALKANPKLAAKPMQLTVQMRALQEKLNDAMIKADPKVAPIVAKFEGAHPTPSTTSPATKAE